MMNVYQLYGLCIHSELPLPAPESTFVENSVFPDLIVKKASVGNRPTTLAELGSFKYALDGSDIVAQVASLAWFRISGKEILVECDAPERPRATGVVLASWIMTLYLMRRGYLLFHGSAVEYNGRAVVILGNCGAGKSTTAAALSVEGHAVLCDDMVPISANKDQGSAHGMYPKAKADLPLVYPGIPWLKLLPDAFSTFAGDPTHYPQLFDGLEKFRMQPKHTAMHPVGLALVCVLDTADIPHPIVHEVMGKDKLRMLIPHMSNVDAIEKLGTVFIHLSSMLDKVTVLKITRPIHQDTIGWMIATIEEALIHTT